MKRIGKKQERGKKGGGEKKEEEKKEKERDKKGEEMLPAWESNPGHFAEDILCGRLKLYIY